MPWRLVRRLRLLRLRIEVTRFLNKDGSEKAQQAMKYVQDTDGVSVNTKKFMDNFTK